MDAPDDPVRDLVARGLYVEAAQLAAARGELGRAVTLLERIFRFAEAIPLALRAGDRVLAVRLALDARDVPLALELAEEIPADDAAGLLRAADTLAARGHLLEAAALAERGGAPDKAAACFERAGALLEAAGAHERAGRFRDAGRLYERQLELPGATEATSIGARLALGRLLGRLGRPRDAVRALQPLQRQNADAGARAGALRLMCGELLALGLPHAADEAARRLRAVDPHAPETAQEIAALEKMTPAGAPGERRRFTNLRLLGAGALGRVYAADDGLLGRQVALKVLGVGVSNETERASLQRFIREAEATRRLRHPHIVSLLEIDEAASVLVLELLPGGTLAGLLAAKGRLPRAAVRRLGLDVLAGLSAAHQAGVVHRDVKPENIFFDAAGNAKLADFGAAHLLDFGQTQTGGFIGTLAYLSPEQITGGAIDFAADLYGLGITLFRALTGVLPFPGPDFVGQHLAAAPPRPSGLRPRLAASHDHVLLRALAKAPAERFASAERMAEAIRLWPDDDDPVDEAPLAAAPAAIDRGESGPLPTALEVGLTARGRLVETRDARAGRAVLLEELHEPLDDTGLAAAARIAAAGGPHVQRLLSVSNDRRRISYEVVSGLVLPRSALSAEEEARLADVWPALAAAGLHGDAVVRTAGGPVVLVCAPLAAPPPP